MRGRGKCTQISKNSYIHFGQHTDAAPVQLTSNANGGSILLYSVSEMGKDDVHPSFYLSYRRPSVRPLKMHSE